MAFRELTVVEVREILRRWSRGSGLRTVAAGTGTDRKTVRRYIEAAKTHGFARGASVDDTLLALVVGEVLPGAPPRVGAMREVCRTHATLIEGWARDGCKAPKIARLLHRHVGIEVPHRTLRRYLRDELSDAKRAGSTVRIVDPPAGQILEIDFMKVGKVTVEDRAVTMWALVCVASFSRHMFVWPCLTQTTDDLIEGLDAAWAYFGGVFPVVVADNPKTIVTHADPLAPTFNPAFAEYSQDRGFVLDQARVRRPKDKARVERMVQYVRNDGFGGERLLGVDHARRHIQGWCSDVAGTRVHGTTRRRPKEAFELREKDLLLPAPSAAYDKPQWVSLTVGRDHAVVVAEALYSVPYRLRGERLRVRFDASTVKMYHSGVVAKVHPRSARGASTIDPEDLPPGTAELATRDASSLKEQAGKAGEAVAEYVGRVLDVPLPWTRIRRVYRLLGLCKTYGNERVNAACRKALDLDVVDVTRIARMLERDLDTTPIPPPPKSPAKVLRPRFGRDPSEFAVSRKGASHE